MFGMKAKETARKWKNSEPKVDDVKAPDVDLGESFRKADAEAPKKKQSFKEAFAAAKDGSTFTWNGKPYKKEYAKTEEPSYRPGGRGPLTRNGGSFPESKKNTPGGRGPLTRASTGPDSKKSDLPVTKAAKTASEFISTGGGPAAGAVAASRYMTRGGGSAPSGMGGFGFEGLKAKRDDFFAKQKAYRESKGMKEPPKPDLTPGQIPALKARSDDFYAKLKANRESKGMNMGGMTGYKKGGFVESKSMMKKEIGFMKKKGAPKSMIKHEEKEAKGMKSGGSCGSSMKKYARGGGIESHGKTKGSMVRMASGGSVSARADGIASKGKTNCKIC